MLKYATCDKCGSRWQVVRELDGRWLGLACLCYQEETEDREGTVIRNEEKLDDYKQLVAGTKGITKISYQ